MAAKLPDGMIAVSPKEAAGLFPLADGEEITAALTALAGLARERRTRSLVKMLLCLAGIIALAVLEVALAENAKGSKAGSAPILPFLAIIILFIFLVIHFKRFLDCGVVRDYAGGFRGAVVANEGRAPTVAVGENEIVEEVSCSFRDARRLAPGAEALVIVFRDGSAAAVPYVKPDKIFIPAEAAEETEEEKCSE